MAILLEKEFSSDCDTMSLYLTYSYKTIISFYFWKKIKTFQFFSLNIFQIQM